MLVQEYVWRLHIEFMMMVSLVCSHQHVKKRRSKSSNVYGNQNHLAFKVLLKIKYLDTNYIITVQGKWETQLSY